MVEEHLLEPVDVELCRQLAADLADDLVVVQVFPAQIDAAEQLPFEVPVELFDQPSVGTARPVLQEHQGQLALWAEDGGLGPFFFWAPPGRGPKRPRPRGRPYDLAQVAFKETLEELFELFLLGGK